MKRIMLFSMIIFIIDQIVKLFVGFSLELNTSITVFRNFFYISNVHNYGAAFSILYGNRIFLVIVSIITLVLVYYFLLKNKKFDWFNIILYSLLIGGILGNLFDRIIYGYVIDYLDFYIFGYNFPIFNIADICIVISVILIIIDTLWGGKGEVRGK
ncbi:MAG: signal peptidase II [Bacilli bacterium]